MVLQSLEKKSAYKRRVAVISQDSFYISLDEENLKKAERQEYNFDHPDSFDWDLMIQVLRDLSQGKPVKIPHYDFVTHSRTKETTTIQNVDIVVFEGILAFYNSDLRKTMNMKIFVDTDADTRLARRGFLLNLSSSFL